DKDRLLLMTSQRQPVHGLLSVALQRSESLPNHAVRKVQRQRGTDGGEDMCHRSAGIPFTAHWTVVQREDRGPGFPFCENHLVILKHEQGVIGRTQEMV